MTDERERGSVTAELAVGLPAVVLLVVLLLALASAAVADLRCGDAARAGAREAALGSADDAVRATASRVGGAGIDVLVARADGWVDVTVTRRVSLGPWLAPMTVGGRASAKGEP